jgi:hypothetical protein
MARVVRRRGSQGVAALRGSLLTTNPFVINAAFHSDPLAEVGLRGLMTQGDLQEDRVFVFHERRQVYVILAGRGNALAGIRGHGDAPDSFQ